MIAIKRAVLVLATMMLGAVLFEPAASAQYQPGQPGFTLQPSLSRPAGVIQVIGYGCSRNQPVTVSIAGQVVATTTAAADGEGSFQVAITAPTTPGEHVVTVRCGNVVLSQILSVELAPTTTTNANAATQGTLPRTGSDLPLPLTRMAVVLVVAGGVLVLAVRRRHATAP